MLFNKSFIAYVLGVLLIIEGSFMLMPGIVAIIYGEPDTPYHFISALVCCMAGSVLAFLFRNHERSFGRRDGYVIVSAVWIVFSLFGALPFWLSGALPSFTDAFYETMSGFTTTGSSVLTDIESAPHGILFWRSLTQWLGGMGIIMLSLAVLPMLGICGMQLFSAESSGAMSDKLRPKISEVARRIWLIYTSLTIVQTLLLMLGGMSLFEAVCHSFSTLSTGGFSTRNASLAAYDSAYIEYVVMLFMFVGGVNFALYYAILLGKFNRLKFDDELKYFTVTTIALGLLGGIVIYFSTADAALENSVRDSLFLVLSVVTTTGFTTADYSMWPHALVVIIAMLIVSGACTGSTSGGIKSIRFIVLLKTAYHELRQTLHPSAVIQVKINGRSLSVANLVNTVSFMAFFFSMIFVGMIFVSLWGYDFEDSYGLVANSLANVGISVGNFGPSGPYTFASLPDVLKWFLALLMLIGRLEIFTVALLFTGYFWKQ